MGFDVGFNKDTSPQLTQNCYYLMFFQAQTDWTILC